MTIQKITVKPGDVVQVEQVGGDLKVQGVDSADLQAQGDEVRLERRSAAVAISAGGDLVLTMPRGASLAASTIGGDARVEDLDGSVEVRIVGGDLVLRNLSGAVRLSGNVGGDTQLENVSSLSMSSAGRGPAGDLSERIRAKVEAATRRAESRIHRAEARVAQARGFGFRWGSNTEPAPAAPIGDPVTEDERLAVLRMLRDKKITSEQADKLLAALEGKA